jgi:hypothetical protein
VLNQQPRGGPRAPAPIEPISTVLRIAPEGVVLGAGTILLPADGPRQLRTTNGCEARVLALLSAAYDRAVGPVVLLSKRSGKSRRRMPLATRSDGTFPRRTRQTLRGSFLEAWTMAVKGLRSSGSHGQGKSHERIFQIFNTFDTAGWG